MSALETPGKNRAWQLFRRQLSALFRLEAWSPGRGAAALHRPPRPDTPLGLYLHIPFCRKRCKFCYFRVYTDKNARDVEVYLDALAKEVELYSKLPIVGGRPLHYFYFGGGTPSYLSVTQLRTLTDRLREFLPWDKAAEVTFECEPGTLQEHKLEALKEIGVTRLSLGVENFDDKILESNGRAHLSHEVYRSLRLDQGPAFRPDQHRPDRRHGGRDVGQLARLRAQDHRAVPRQRDDLPDGIAVQHGVFAGDAVPRPTPVADWPTKRAWVQYAFDELAGAGYQASSAYTMVKDKARCRFVYRDSLWHGADMFGTGVASFGHVGGVHVQNVDTWEQYLEHAGKGRVAARPGLAGNAAPAPDPRDDLAAKNGTIGWRLFSAEIRGGYSHRFRGRV